MGSVTQSDAWEILTADAYDVLGVAPKASDADIRRAWRRHIKLSHPDVTGQRERFTTVQLAYQCLTPPETRARYDLVRADITAEPRTRFTSPAAQPTAPPSPGTQQCAPPAGSQASSARHLWRRRGVPLAPLTVNAWAHSCVRAVATVGLLTWLFAVGMFTTTTTQRSPFAIVDTFSVWIPVSVTLLWLTYLTVMTVKRRPVLSWAGQSAAAAVVMIGLMVALTQLPFTGLGWALAGVAVVVFAANMLRLRASPNPSIIPPTRHS